MIPNQDIVRDQALDLAAQLLEPALDALLEEGLLRELPVLGAAVRLAGVTQSISDRILLAKIERFMRATADVSDAERKEFAYRLKRDHEFRERVGQTVALALDRCDDMDKPEILARAFRALVRGTIELADFRRLAAAIDRAYVGDLRELMERDEDNRKAIDLLRRLLPAGLTEFAPVATAPVYSSGEVEVPLSPMISELGRVFLRVMGGR